MQKNHDDFINILEQQKAIIFKISHSYGKNVEDRRDLSQEIVIQIWRSLHRFDPKYNMSTWIYRIALNTAISFYRKTKKDDSKSDIPVEEILEGYSFSENNNHDLVDRLYEFINELDSLNKALILLVLEDYNHETIASILGISVSNVSTKIGRIKKKLKERFESEELKKTE